MGWFSRFSGNGVTVRVPTASADAYLAAAQELGDVDSRQYGREDLGARIADLESRLKARREVLGRYLEVLDEASPKAVVQVEQEITRVVAEIEGLEGQLRVMADRVDHSEVSLSFRYRERRAPVRDGGSSFAWLNTMNVADLLDDLENGWRSSWSRSSAIAPAGFAPFPKPWRFQAVSSDDVAFRVRSLNQPAAELDFGGRRSRAEWLRPGTGSGRAGGHGCIWETLLELGAANGERDQTYLVAVFVDGRHLVIVEATGEADRFRARRADVVAAIGSLGWTTAPGPGGFRPTGRGLVHEGPQDVAAGQDAHQRELVVADGDGTDPLGEQDLGDVADGRLGVGGEHRGAHDVRHLQAADIRHGGGIRRPPDPEEITVGEHAHETAIEGFHHREVAVTEAAAQRPRLGDGGIGREPMDVAGHDLLRLDGRFPTGVGLVAFAGLPPRVVPPPHPSRSGLGQSRAMGVPGLGIGLAHWLDALHALDAPPVVQGWNPDSVPDVDHPALRG